MDEASIINFNRNTLSSVDNWIKKSDWEIPNSLYNYGLPHYIYHLINLPISNEITEADMICKFIVDLSRQNVNVHYLEIGVSVGKTFYQILNFAKVHLLPNTFTIACLDIEKINPILDKLLIDNIGGKSTITIPSTNVSTLRKNELNYISNWNETVYYFESDEFDSSIWKAMTDLKKKYNLIFSDALHEPNALVTEYTNLRDNLLFDEARFIYCFDDLEDNEAHGQMWNAVKFIHSDILKTYPNTTLDHHVINGWIGEHEHKHHFGVIYAKL